MKALFIYIKEYKNFFQKNIKIKVITPYKVHIYQENKYVKPKLIKQEMHMPEIYQA